MSLDKLRPFDDQETLKEIRTNVLNPLSDYVKNTIDPAVKATKEDVKKTYKDIKFDANTKKFTLSKTDPTSQDQEIDLSGVIPEDFEGIEVHGSGGGSSTKVKEITFEHGLLTGTQDSIHIDFEWDKIVPEHQEPPQVQIGTDAAKPFTKIAFSGNKGKVTLDKQTLNFDIPSDPVEIKASVQDSSGGTVAEKVIKKILIEGNTSGSTVTDDGELKLNIPTGGGPSTTGGNFQGFFSSLGDLESSVDNPVNGKSFAFVKDAKLKNKYYTPYMYVSNGWTEAPTDPAITFEPVSGSPQGVFSIKPDTRIKIDPLGQLDLGLLGDGHFVGFFDTQDELDQACPNPLIDKTMAYVKVEKTGVYSAMKYALKSNGDKAWVSVTPYGLISAVEKNTDGTIKVAQPIYAIEKNDAVTVSDNLLTIKPPAEQSVTVVANVYPSGVQETHQVTEINFIDGNYVQFTDEGKTALIHHPHKTINYSPQFEIDHSSKVFLGNIFYDLEKHKWMGYTPNSLPTEPHWTYIAHRGMSEEVKSLVYRYPVKAPTILPSAQSQDDQHWGHNGVSYSESGGDIGLGSEYSNVGVYVETIVQNTKDDDDSLAPKNRIQIAYTEAKDSEIFIRFSDPNAQFPSNPWKEWVKTSVSPSDIVNHNEDPEAHKETNRFYKVYTLNSLYKAVKTDGYIYDRTTHVLPVADNRGLDSSSHGYFKLPYPGDFKLSGRFELDNTSVAQNTWLKGVWIARIYKVKVDGQKVLLQSFAYEHTYSNKPYPGMSFKTSQTFAKGESVLFYIDFQQDSSVGGQFITRAPHANFMSWRSYLVLEDAATDAGWKIAESFRKTHGMFYSNGGTAVNTHPTDLDSPNSWPRVYGKAVDLNTTGMHTI